METCVNLWEYRWILLRMRNIFNKSSRENQNTHFVFSNFFRKSCRYWDKVEKYDTAGQAADDSITRRMRFACWITMVTNPHSEYVILIAFPLLQWFRECISMFHLCVHYLSFYSNGTCFEGFTATESNTSCWGWKPRQVAQIQMNHMTGLSARKACWITTVPNLYAFFMQLW